MSGSGPCATCRKACCANYTVSINGHDAWIIGKALHLPLESFLIHFSAVEQNERGFLLAPMGPRYEIALDKAGRYQKGNPCVFWIELQSGGGRCGIYPYRPMVCQTYPTYQQQGLVVLRDDVLCPEGAWNLVGMDLPVFRKRLASFRIEQDIYVYFVSRWNHRVEQSGRTATIRDYYTALMNVYDGIDRWARDLSRETVNELFRKWGEMPPASPNPLFVDIGPLGDREEWRSSLALLRDRMRHALPLCTESPDLVPAALS